jgi:hypothetical protein
MTHARGKRTRESMLLEVVADFRTTWIWLPLSANLHQTFQ